MLRNQSFMWELKVLSKVSIFAWRFILGRLPTRQQAKIRGILVDDRECCCVFCFNVLEDSIHLFDSCPFTRRIWSKIGQWLGISDKMTNEELRSFFEHFDKIKAKDERLTVDLIWFAVL